MIIDGEELKLVCKCCGHKYTHIIGYGPICPSHCLREIMLKKNPPVCPKCGSHDWKYRNLISRIFGL